MSRISLACLLATIAQLGCSPTAVDSATDPTAGTELRLPQKNGPILVGTGLVALTSGPGLRLARVENGELIVELDNGQVRRGQGVAGMTLAAIDGGINEGLDSESDRTSPYFHITSVSLQGGVYTYTTESPSRVQQDFETCGAGGARVMPGRWYMNGTYDPNAPNITFACANGAAAKCMGLGYLPNGSIGASPIAMRDALIACTRAVRADYCGSGTATLSFYQPGGFVQNAQTVATTTRGRPLNLWDVYGLVPRAGDVVDFGTDDEGGLYPIVGTFEAAWSPSGATCVSHERLLRSPTSNLSGAYLPPLQCGAQPMPSCGGEVGTPIGLPTSDAAVSGAVIFSVSL